MVFTEIVQEVADRMGLTSAEALTRIGVNINRRYRQLTSSLGLNTFRRLPVVQAVVTGTRLQTVTGVERIISVFDFDTAPTAPRSVELISYDEMLEKMPTTGLPRFYAVKAQGARSVTLMFDTSFDDALDLTYECEQNASTLSGSQEPALSESFQDILVTGAMADEYRKKEKIQLGRDAEAEVVSRTGELRLQIALGAYQDIYQGKTKDTTHFSGGSGGSSTDDDDDVFLYYNVKDPLYGASGDGVHDDTVAVQAAYTAAGLTGGTVVFPPGTYLCTADINVPVGAANVVNTLGTSWGTGGLLFSGAAVTRGLSHYEAAAPGTYSYCGTVSNIKIRCANSATHGLTFYNVNHPRAERVYVANAAGRGIYFNYTLMGRLEHSLLTGCGSATEGSVEVDNSTTFDWNQSRISGGTTTVGGLLIDRTPDVSILGGAIESCGTPILLGSKAEATTPVSDVIIDGVDLEHPGQHYIEMGYGWSGTTSNGIKSVSVRNVHGTTSGATDVRYGVKIHDGVDVHFENCGWGLTGGTQTAYHWLQGNTTIGTRIEMNRRAFSGSVPWVMSNGSQLNSASPLVDWSQNAPVSVNTALALTGATPSLLVSAQGGISQFVNLTQGGATTVTQFSFGGDGNGLSLYVLPGDANTTFQQSVAATQGTLKLLSGKDTPAKFGQAYHFWCDGTYWHEVGGSAKQIKPIGDSTDIGTNADLLEKTLATFTIPAGVFDTTLITGFTFNVSFTVVAAGGVIRFKVDGTQEAITTAASIAATGAVLMRVTGFRVGNTLEGDYIFYNASAAVASVMVAGGFSAAITPANTVVLAITGQNDSVSTADRVQYKRGFLAFHGAPSAAFN